MTAPKTTISTTRKPRSKKAAQPSDEPDLTITGSGKDRQISGMVGGEKLTCRVLLESPIHGAILTFDGKFFADLARRCGPHIIRFTSMPDSVIFIVRPESPERDTALLERAYQLPTRHEPITLWDGDLFFDLGITPMMIDGQEVHCMTASGTKVPARLEVPGYPDEVLVAVRPKHKEEDVRAVLAAGLMASPKRRTTLKRRAAPLQVDLPVQPARARRTRRQAAPVCV